MDKQEAARSLTDLMARFTGYIGKRLPQDVLDKLTELRAREVKPLAKVVYDSMFENLETADKLNRPCCQDTGVIQFFVRAGAQFPLLGELKAILGDAVRQATRDAPLRHNAVETFVEKNTGDNTGRGVPWIEWEIVPDDDTCTIEVYMAGGGCTLPGAAKVLMPAAGYEGVVQFVFDVITSYGVNACPPLLVGDRRVDLGRDGQHAVQARHPAPHRHPPSGPARGRNGIGDREGLERHRHRPAGADGQFLGDGRARRNPRRAIRRPSAWACRWAAGRTDAGPSASTPDLSYEILSHKGVTL